MAEGFLIENNEVIGRYETKGDTVTIYYKGKKIQIDLRPGGMDKEKSLFALENIAPADRIILLSSLAEALGETKDGLLEKLIGVEVKNGWNSGKIIVKAFYRDISMTIEVRKVPGYDDVVIIEYPENIYVPQFSMFQQFKEEMSKLSAKSTDEEIISFATKYAKKYVKNQIEEILF